MNYNELAKEIYLENKEKGFWDEPRSEQYCLMLIITELSEAVEAFRKHQWANLSDVKDQLGLFNAETFKLNIKDSVQDEISDAYIRILDMVGAFDIDIVMFMPSRLKSKSMVDASSNFISNCYWITADLMSNAEYGIETALCDAMISINALCDIFDFNLMDHVALKRNYNKTRPRLHGKIC